MGSGADAEVLLQVTERAQRIRDELVALLREGGPAVAADLLPAIKTEGVSLSEVAFQLSRLADEGKAVGREGEAYRLP